MSDGSIKIKIGASADRSIDQVFGSIEKRAQVAGQNINKAIGNAMGGGGNGRKPFDEAKREADRAAKEIEKRLKEETRARAAAAREQLKIERDAAREKQRIEDNNMRYIRQKFMEGVRERAKVLRQQEREERAASKRIEAERSQFAERTSHRAIRFMFPNPIGAFGMAHRVGVDILRGAGIDFSLGSSVSRFVSAQQAAAELSNRGLIEGDKGPNGQRVATATLEGEARKIANDLSLDIHDVLGAQNKFVGLTGNLDLSRKLQGSVSSIAGAFGANQEETAGAAAELANHLVGMSDDEKLKVIPQLLRNMGQMNAIGATDMAETAKYMGRIAAPAAAYGGDISKNMIELTALAEIAKKEGGATTASEAFGSIPNFTATFQKAARLKGLHKLGVTDDDLFNMRTERGPGGKVTRIRESLKDPFDIITTVMKKTKGDFVSFFQAFPDMRGSKAVKGLQTIYNRAGGGKAGEEAVLEELHKFTSATMSARMEQEKNAERQKTLAAQAQEFQNKLDEVGKEVASEVLPAMKDLEPVVLKLAHIFGETVSWAAKHPEAAIVTAIGLAISRAVAESTLRAGIEGLVKGGGGASVAAIGTGTATGAAGTASKILGGLAAGAAAGGLAYTLGSIGNAYGYGDQYTTRDLSAIAGLGVGGFQAFGKTGGAAGLAIAGVGSAIDQYDKLTDVTEGSGGVWAGVKSLFSGNGFFKGVDEYQNERARERHRTGEDQAQATKPNQPTATELAQSIGTAVAGKELRVRVVNPQDIKDSGPTVGPNGRDRPPGAPKH